MSLREFESLVAICDAGSITAAAERLFLSVPAVSAHITNLESQFRTSLLDRRRKPARLNSAGQLLSARAREVVHAYRQLCDAAVETVDLAGNLTVGASPTLLTNVIPQSLVALRKAYPRLQIRMCYGRSSTLLKKLQHGELDAIVVSQPQVALGGVSWTGFAHEPVNVIAPPGAKGRTDEALLAEFPYIRFGKHLWVGDAIEAHLAQRGIVPDEIMEVDSREAIALMVHHGLGVSIVPESDPSLRQLYGLREVPLGKPPLTRHIGLARTPGDSLQPLTDALLNSLRLATQSSRHGPHGKRTSR